MIKSNRGQLSIFMGITLIIVMSMLAFIINVGLFVKAKINLQNATDAAAFAGAATQARQLTNIAYLNWEIRNTYKEWMFKYYVLGQLGLIDHNLSEAKIGGTDNINFLIPNPPSTQEVSGITDYDKYNIPTICIHNNSKTNICPIYALPGIPRFPAIGVAGISEIHEAFVEKLVEEKSKDCSRRSKANFITALSWAYGAGDGVAMPEAPLVATNRPGAWPEALQLAFRMRNLEMIVNRPPVANITLDSVRDFQGQSQEIGLNERPIKAFWSAYRNLGGGDYKDCRGSADCGTDELSYHLNLTELSPKAYNAAPNSVSGFLIPDSFVYPGAGGGRALDKHYLDLQMMPVNLATMFSTFVDMKGSVSGTEAHAACGVSKTALPVPGYIMGFNKNPEVLTYYAVKAETKFIGLFFPIPSEGIKLTAYAAAKPFGGRIGPKLFSFIDGNRTVEARGTGGSDPNHRSASLISGLSIEVGSTGFKPGMPIPSSDNFWVDENNRVIGGIPGTGTAVNYGIPNMIYDFKNESEIDVQLSSSDTVQQIKPLMSYSFIPKEKLGLYHAPQMKALRASFGAGLLASGSELTGDEVFKSILRARRPTRYDAMNYLIPSINITMDSSVKVNAAPYVQKLDNMLGVSVAYKLFAPLYGPDLLYKTPDATKDIVKSYMAANDVAINRFLEALLAVGKSISDLGASNVEAARSIHANAPDGPATPAPLKFGAPATDPECKMDMASKFNHFFREEATGCEMKPLKSMMVDYIAKAGDNNGGLGRLFYVGFYYNEPNDNLRLKPEQLMSAYYPGKRQGGSDTGITEHPFGITASESKKRNFYSTKFFHMAKIIEPVTGTTPGIGSIVYSKNPALLEKSKPHTIDNQIVQIANPLNFSDLGNNSYFLDF